ncbi:MAG TPA: PfkB family carbohydrate kinase [Polyangia bacterium]|nr:PfkB family carbohydrate kinase [Polyangia bacterium]
MPAPDRVVGIGQATVDQLAVGPRSMESVVEMHRFSIQAGGAVGTALATVCAFGGIARYVGRLSDDEFGQIILRGLKDFGVDTSQVLIEPGKISPASFIMVDERTGRRTVRFTRGSTTPLEPGELPKNLLDEVALLMIDGRVPSAQIAAAERAKALGIPVLLDARHLGPGMGELLDLCDVVIGSERFAAEISHSSDVKRSLRELTKMGPRTVVITLGEEGAIGLESEAVVRHAALPIEIFDTTGASDVFRGAFAYGVIHGWGLDRCLPFANTAAGLNCRHLGGLGGIPSLAEVIRTAGISAT